MRWLVSLRKISILLIFSIIFICITFKKVKIKIGIFGCRHDKNIGNFLIKYAMSTKLIELGYDPYIVTTNHKRVNISFINSTTKIIIVENYSEIKENDYDILLVNSDQTWRKWDKYFYHCGFLKFAEKWNKLKFVYGASLGYDYYAFNKKDELIIKPLIKQFSGISVREIGSIKLIKEHLGISPKLVLDPTLIIDKKYYLNLIKEYKSDVNDTINYIFVYILYKPQNKIESFVKRIKRETNFKIYYYNMNNYSLVEDFIYHIKNSKAVITNSFHCTIFSILFSKPFISFIVKKRINTFN